VAWFYSNLNASVGPTVDRHRAADRIALAEIAPRHRRIDHRHRRYYLEIVRLDVAAAQHVRADGAEVVRADLVERHLALRIRLRGEARHVDVPA